MLSLTIDGREVEVDDGSTILEAAEAAGVYIPTFCYHKRLMPFGACRMCIVEVEQMKGRLVPSCSTPAANGMVIHTNTPRVRKERKTLLELLLVHHPLDCPVCDKGGECKLQDLVYDYELSSNRFFDEKFHHDIESASPLIERNVNRCVLCGMCTRVCDEVVGVAEISFANRGFQTKIGTDFDRVLDCEFCGECVNICPVGALTDKLFKYKARSWELNKVNTICSYCGTGCTLTLGIKGNRIYRIIGDDTIGVNKGSLCAKGRFGYQYITSPERMNSPLIKNESGELVRATWEEAGTFHEVGGGRQRPSPTDDVVAAILAPAQFCPAEALPSTVMRRGSPFFSPFARKMRNSQACFTHHCCRGGTCGKFLRHS